MARKPLRAQKIGPPRNYVAYFSIAQEIGMRIEELGNEINKLSPWAPATHELILDNLRQLRTLCDRAESVMADARTAWDGTT